MIQRKSGLMSGRIVAVLWLAATLQGQAAEFELRSGVTQVGLLELYTSEGCNSCPPADRWLRSLAADAGLWERFVPVAFHVDYWDYIGWQDRFADPEHSDRQRSHAAAGGKRTIYTPGFFLNGEEWRDWRQWGLQRPIELPIAKAGGVLGLVLEGSTATVTYTPNNGVLSDPQVHVAVLGFGLTSQVRAGENVGRQLEHDFVALNWVQGNLAVNNGRYQGAVEVQVDPQQADRLALAAWVSNGRDPAPLQAVGGWLPAGQDPKLPLSR